MIGQRLGTWRGSFEMLRRGSGTAFEAGAVDWQAPGGTLPIALHASGERRVSGSGYRFRELGSRLGPKHLFVDVGWRRTDSLEGYWRKSSDLYRVSSQWQITSARADGLLTVHYQRREFVNFETGSDDRLLAESRWLWRQGAWSVRLEHRLSRAQALSENEEYVPVVPGRGDYREENGQIIADPLGDLVRVVRQSAYGALARQSEKRAHLVWQRPARALRMELDLVTTETAADADLPDARWLLPWTVDATSPTRRRVARSEVSAGPASQRLIWRGEWTERLDLRASRSQDFQRLSTEVVLRSRVARPLRIEWRAGGGRERELQLFPYYMTFALASVAPAWRPREGIEVVVPLFVQRYWDASGASLADWTRSAVRGAFRIGRRSRIVIEPSLNKITAYRPGVPLAVADGRPPGTSAEWRAEGSLDLSGILVGRVLYRGRSQTGRPTLHRADISVEATF